MRDPLRSIAPLTLGGVLCVLLAIGAGCGESPEVSAPMPTTDVSAGVAASDTSSPASPAPESVPTESAAADIDTTTTPPSREGYESSVRSGRWVLVERRDQSLVVLVAGGGCNTFNGYRLRQESAVVRLDVFNTVLTPRSPEPGGPRYACTTEFSGSRQEIALSRPLGDAEVIGGCAAEESADEDLTCQMLRRLAQHTR